MGRADEEQFLRTTPHQVDLFVHGHNAVENSGKKSDKREQARFNDAVRSVVREK